MRAAMAERSIPFVKMHGLGNDFVIIDVREEALRITAERVQAIADRRLGIGCDQVILLEASAKAVVRMRIFNADGSQAQACGNAARCVAQLLGPQLLGETALIETLGGLVQAEPLGAGLLEGGARILLGKPRFEWNQIPLAMPMDTRAMPVAWEELEFPAAVNVGNPHIIFFVADEGAVALERLGPLIENDPLFPERINVNIARIAGSTAGGGTAGGSTSGSTADDARICLRVWERGAGLTRACGTGACATAVAAIRANLVSSPVTVVMPGGRLEIAWAPGEEIAMSGSATQVFEGKINWEQFE